MERNYKKGFTLAEALMIFLLISVTLAAFAPFMTRKAQKKVDESCVNGTKSVFAEYTNPGTYTFTAPEEITGDSIVTLVGGGGRGGNAEIISYDDDENITSYRSGYGGGGGGYARSTISLTPNTSYTVTVGVGGTSEEEYGGSSSFSGSLIETITAQGGMNASNSAGGGGGISGGQQGSGGGENIEPGSGGGNSEFSASEVYLGGAPGEVCTGASDVCKPHGKPGSGYEQSGLSDKGFIAGTGGGGGGVEGSTKTEGVGGMGGSGYAKIEYQIRCE